MITPTRERRDWTLLIFIIPIGIILMLIAGQIAIRLVPTWSINAGMQSKLDPNNLPAQQSGLVQPVLPAILTPLGWLDTFLTPGADSGGQNIVFPPFVVFEPTATPAVTLLPPTVATTPPPTITTTVSPTAVVIPPSVTSTQDPQVTSTQKPPVDEPTSTPPTVVPTTVTVVPTVITPAPVTSTPTGALVPSVPTPAGFNIGAANGGTTYTLPDNSFYVVDLGPTQANQIRVNGPSDTNYDMVYYEYQNPAGYISMDQVIVGISQFPNGSTYYTVFNWGNGSPDTNSNVGAVAGTEADNQLIATTVLYGTPVQTGIAIDVDNAPSAPPVGWYQYIVILAPGGGSGDGVDVDAVQVIELLNPSMAIASISSVKGASVQPAVDAAATQPTADTATTQPVTDAVATQPAADTAATQPETDAAATQPATDTAATQPAVDAGPAQPAVDQAPAQPAVDTAPAQPAVDTAPAQPVDAVPIPATTP